MFYFYRVHLRLLLFLLFCFQSLTAQHLTYAVMLRDEKVGELYVHRTVTKKNAEFKIESFIHVDKLINMEVEYKLVAKFEDGILLRSSTWQRSNQKVNINTTTTRSGNVYHVESLNRSAETVKETIDFNLCTLYYQEPVGRTKIWSDSYGAFIQIKPAGNHRYEIILPDGKKNFYTYHYGICSMVETEQLFSKIVFRLIPSKRVFSYCVSLCYAEN